MVETPTAKRIHSEPDRLWRIVTDYPDIFDSLILPKLNSNDVKFFYDVNSESRVVIKRSSGSLCATFKICDFFTKSTLSWALEKCSERKERFWYAAAKIGHFECLKYLHESGCPWDERTCYGAARGGHLECLKYAHEKGCPWDKRTCSEAARVHLECLKYAHENGCPWDERTCSEAARKGHLACLKYAHENGCPWMGDTCSYAAYGGHLKCLKYLHENGCPT